MRSPIKNITALILAVLLFAPVSFAQEVGWTVFHAPASNAQATVTKPAVAGYLHVADCVVATFVASALPAAAVVATLVLRDGASGSGTIKAQWSMALPTTAGASSPPIQLCGLRIEGTVNTAMTLEFTAAGGVNTVQAVFLRGYYR